MFLILSAEQEPVQSPQSLIIFWHVKIHRAFSSSKQNMHLPSVRLFPLAKGKVGETGLAMETLTQELV